MLVKNLAIVACLASAVMAQVNSIFCQARYITNVATCVIGVKECNTIEQFSACVCSNTQNKAAVRNCLLAMLRSPDFQGTLTSSDCKALSV